MRIMKKFLLMVTAAFFVSMPVLACAQDRGGDFKGEGQLAS